MKLKWKLWLRVFILFVILGFVASSASIKNSPNEEDSTKLEHPNDTTISRHRRFIGTTFSLDHMLSKMTNVMGFFGLDTSGMFWLQKMYNSAFSQKHLLFKRKMLNLIMRTCHFILGYLPEEPLLPHNFFTTDYRLSYQTGKNQRVNGDTNIVDSNQNSDITNVKFTNNKRLETVTQKKILTRSSPESDSNNNSKIVYLDLKTDSETNVEESNNLRKKRSLAARNLVDAVLENAILEAEILHAEFASQSDIRSHDSNESRHKQKRSLHLNVNFASRYYNERSTTTSTRAPFQIQKNVHVGFDWSGSTSYRQQHRDRPEEYQEDDYIDDDVFLRRRRQADIETVDGITTEVSTTASEMTEEKEEDTTETTTATVETDTEMMIEETTKLTEFQKNTMTNKDFGNKQTEKTLLENGISIEEITSSTMEVPENENEEQADKILIQMGKKYFPAEIILTHTTKPNQGSEEKMDDDMGGDEDEKEEDPAHQLLYLVDGDKSGEVPQEIIVDDHVLSEVLNKMDKVTTMVPPSMDVTNTETNKLATKIVTDLVSNEEEKGEDEEVEEQYKVNELMQRLEILEQIVRIMSDMIDAQEAMKAIDTNKFEETGANEEEKKQETTTMKSFSNIGFHVSTKNFVAEGASTTEDETQESTTMLLPITTEVLLTTTKAPDTTVTTDEVQATIVIKPEKNFEENEVIVTTTEVGTTIPLDTMNHDNVPFSELESDLQSVISLITTTTATPTTTETPVSLVFPEGYSPEDVDVLSKNLMHHKHLKHLAEGNHLNHLILKLAKDVNINDLDVIMDNIEQRLDNHEKKLMVLVTKKKMNNIEATPAIKHTEIKAQQQANNERLIRMTLNSSEVVATGKEEQGKEEEKPKGEVVPLPISLLQKQEQADLVSGKRDERKRLFVSEVGDVTTSTTIITPSVVSSTVRTNDRMKMFSQKLPHVKTKKTKPSDQMMVESGDKMAAMQTGEMAASSTMIQNMKRFRIKMQMKNESKLPDVTQMHQMMTENKTPYEHFSIVQETKPKLDVMEEHVEDDMSMKKNKEKHKESFHHISDINMMMIKPHKMTTKPPHRIPTNMKETPAKNYEDEDNDDDDYDISLEDIVDYFVGDYSDEDEEEEPKGKNSMQRRSKRYLINRFKCSLDSFRKTTNNIHFQNAFRSDNQPDWQPVSHTPSYKVYPYQGYQPHNKEVKYVVYPSEYSAPYPARFVPQSQPCDIGPWIKFEGLEKIAQGQNNFDISKLDYSVISSSTSPTVVETTQSTTITAEVIKEVITENNIGLKEQTGDVNKFSLPSSIKKYNFKVVQNKEMPNISQIVSDIEFNLLPLFENGQVFQSKQTVTNTESQSQNNLHKEITKIVEETLKNNLWKLKNPENFNTNFLTAEASKKKNKKEENQNHVKVTDKHKEHVIFSYKDDQRGLSVSSAYLLPKKDEVHQTGQRLDAPVSSQDLEDKDVRIIIRNEIDHSQDSNNTFSNKQKINQKVSQDGSQTSQQKITNAITDNLKGQLFQLKNPEEFSPLTQTYYNPKEISLVGVEVVPFDVLNINKNTNEEISQVIENNVREQVEKLKVHGEFNQNLQQSSSSQMNFDSEKKKRYEEITKAVKDNVQDKFDRLQNHLDFQSGFGPNLAHQEITRVVEKSLQKKIDDLKRFTNFQELKTFQNSQNSQDSQTVSTQVNFNSEKMKTYQEITNAVEKNVQGKFEMLKANINFHSGFGPNLVHQEITKVVEDNLENKFYDLKSYTDFHASLLGQDSKKGPADSSQVNFDSEKQKMSMEITEAVENQLQNQLQNLKDQLQITTSFVPNTSANTDFGKTAKVNKMTETATAVSYNTEQQKTYREITQAVEDSVQGHFNKIKNNSEFNSTFGPNLVHQEITKVIKDDLQQKLASLKSHSDFLLNSQSQNLANHEQISQSKVDFDTEKQQTYREITKALEDQLQNQPYNLKNNSNFLPVPLTRLESQKTIEKPASSDIYDKEPFVSVVLNPSIPRVSVNENGPKNGLYLSTVYMPQSQTPPKTTDQKKVPVINVKTGARPAPVITTPATPVKPQFGLVSNSETKQTNHKLQTFEDSIRAVVGGLTNNVEGSEYQKLAKDEKKEEQAIKEIELTSRFGVHEEVSEFPPLIHQSRAQQNFLSSSDGQQLRNRNIVRTQIHNQNIFLGSSPQSDGDVLIFSRFGADSDTGNTPSSTTLVPPTTSIQTTFVTSTSTVTEKLKQFKLEDNVIVNYIYKQPTNEAQKGFSSGSSANPPSIKSPIISSSPQINLSKLEKAVPQGPRRGDIIESIEETDSQESGVQIGVASKDELERRNIIINRIKEEQQLKHTRLNGQVKHEVGNVLRLAESDTDEEAILRTYGRSEFGKKIV